MKPLIILGNGKSLADVNLKKLESHNTFGLNNAFSHYQELNFFPKFYGIFDLKRSKIDVDNAVNFLRENYNKMQTIFYYGKRLESLFSDVRKFPDALRLQYVNLDSSDSVHLTVDTHRHSLPLELEFQIAAGLITEETEKKNFAIYLEFLNRQEYELLNLLNKDGILRQYRKEKLDPSCYITKQRFNLNWWLPKSFEDFNFQGATSAVVACLLGYLVGYKKIILLGMDNKWKISNDELDTKETYWFENYFQNPYNVKEFCATCTSESIQELHIDCWTSLKEKLEANNVDIEIVNCTPDSTVQCFRNSTLDKEI